MHSYLSTLRGPARRLYAIEFWQFLFDSTRVEPDPIGLSPQAARAIREDVMTIYTESMR